MVQDSKLLSQRGRGGSHRDRHPCTPDGTVGEGSPRTLEQLGFWYLHMFKLNTPLYLLDRPLDRRCATRGSRERAIAGEKTASRRVLAAGCATCATRRRMRMRPGVPCRCCSTARTGAAGEYRPRMRRPWAQPPGSACRRPPAAAGVLAGPPGRRWARSVACVLPITNGTNNTITTTNSTLLQQAIRRHCRIRKHSTNHRRRDAAQEGLAVCAVDKARVDSEFRRATDEGAKSPTASRTSAEDRTLALLTHFCAGWVLSASLLARDIADPEAASRQDQVSDVG